MSLPFFFNDVQREGVDGVKISQRAGVEFQEWEIFRVCMLVVINTAIKSQGDTTPNSKIRIFLREVRRRVRGFSEDTFNFVKRFLLFRKHVEAIIATTHL